MVSLKHLFQAQDFTFLGFLFLNEYNPSDFSEVDTKKRVCDNDNEPETPNSLKVKRFQTRPNSTKLTSNNDPGIQIPTQEFRNGIFNNLETLKRRGLATYRSSSKEKRFLDRQKENHIVKAIRAATDHTTPESNQRTIASADRRRVLQLSLPQFLSLLYPLLLFLFLFSFLILVFLTAYKATTPFSLGGILGMIKIFSGIYKFRKK